MKVYVYHTEDTPNKIMASCIVNFPIPLLIRMQQEPFDKSLADLALASCHNRLEWIGLADPSLTRWGY